MPSESPAPSPSPLPTPAVTAMPITIAAARAHGSDARVTIEGVVTAEAGRIGLPPQVNVMGTLIFAAGVLIALAINIRSRRTKKRD